MKLVNMKLDAKAREKTPATIAADQPVYPWGLSLTLDNDSLEKLGIDLPKVGKTLMVTARVDVTGVSSNESESGKNRSVSLQITDLSVSPGEGEGGDAAEKLYPKE
jgi:hypothetical protein